MRFLSTLIILLSCLSATSQTVSQLNSEVVELYNKGDFKNALSRAEDAIDLVNKNGKEKNPEYFFVINNLASLYNKTGSYLKAVQYFKLVSLYQLNAYGKASEQYALSLNRLAIIYEAMKKNDSAEVLYKQAISIYNNLNKKTEDYFFIIDNLGVFYKNAGEYFKALPYYKITAENSRQKSGEASEEYALSINQVAILYEKVGQYDSAINNYKKAILFYEKANKISENYQVIIKNLALLFKSINDNKSAAPLYVQLVEINKTLYGESIAYAITLDDLGLVYMNMGEYVKAEPLFITAREIRKKITGEDNIDYAKTLNNLGYLYYQMGKYEKAEPLYIQAKEIINKLLGPEHTEYGHTLNNLAILYQGQGKSQQAEALYLQSKEITKKILGENTINYAVDINNLGLLYFDMGQYAKAEPLYVKAIEIYKKHFAEKDPGYSTSLNNLALLYVETAQYRKAEPLYIEAKEIRRKVLGKDHPDYATTLHTLAILYKDMGQYEKAEPLYLEAKEIRRKILGQDHPDYAISLNSLGMLYDNLGQYNKAEALYIEAKEIRKKTLGETHPQYAESLNNLGILYMDIGQYQKALQLLLQVLEIDKVALGENHQSYANDLSNVATLYHTMKEYDKAEVLYVRAVDLRKKIFGENHPSYAISLNNLAILYHDVGKYQKAEEILIKTIKIRKEQLGENNNDYARSLRSLGVVYSDMSQFKKAEPLLLASTKIDFLNLFSVFSTMSEKEKEIFISTNIFTSELLNSFLFTNPTSIPLARNNYNTQLILKSLSLADTRNMLEAIHSGKDTATELLFTKWQVNKGFLSQQYSLPVNERIKTLDSIEAATEIMEKELNKNSFAFRNQNTLLNISYEDVRNKLEPNEAAIEFVRFSYFNKVWTDSVFYAAYLLRKSDTVPVFIPLCEEKQLQQLFASSTKSTTALVSALYRGAGEVSNISVSKGDSLYQLIWNPLEPYLNGINKISYSPTGKLYTIAFNALPSGNEKILMDKYQLQQYTSTRQIVLRKNIAENITPKNIALFGDASFTLDSMQLVKKFNSNPTNTTVSTNIYTPQTRGGSNVWNNLPGTAAEVKKIQQLFIQNKIGAKSFEQQQASEENLKALTKSSPHVLHLATHGFFLPETDKKRNLANTNVYSLANDPLMRSGILLAGANYAWSGRSPIKGVEDGIATAYEISQLDLSKTDLVVLSACETALGDIKGSEGVFGLQRAFKMAGVNKLIVSLWQVPDKETAELMTAFYSNWLSGKTIETAFYNAQSEMRKKYSPFYWAAFVLVE